MHEPGTAGRNANSTRTLALQSLDRLDEGPVGRASESRAEQDACGLLDLGWKGARRIRQLRSGRERRQLVDIRVTCSQKSA